MGWGFASARHFGAPNAPSTSCCFFFSPTSFIPILYPSTDGLPPLPLAIHGPQPFPSSAPRSCKGGWRQRVPYDELCPGTQHVPGTTLGTHSKANRDRTTHCCDDKSQVSARSWQ